MLKRVFTFNRVLKDPRLLSSPFFVGFRITIGIWMLNLFTTGCNFSPGAPDCNPTVVLSEYAHEVIRTGSDVDRLLSVELRNTSSCAGSTPRMKVIFANDTLQIGERKWLPEEYLSVRGSVRHGPTMCQECAEIRLVLASDESPVDKVSVPLTNATKLYAGRVPGDSRLFALEDSTEVTLGRPNVDQGPVVKISEIAGFRPRDSSQNATVEFNGQLWILGGWSNFAHDVWYSVSDVWTSRDGVRWSLINSSPPYSPYSAFVVFNNRIWALGPTSYSTVNGVEWRREQLELPLKSQAVVMRGVLVALSGGRILESVDGESWRVLQEKAPWGDFRDQPKLLLHLGELWLIGGYDVAPGPFGVYRNDIWKSSTGSSWTRVTETAPWKARRWHNAVSVGENIIVMNGYSPYLPEAEFGNVADIWVTRKGEAWDAVTPSKIWPARHAAFILPILRGGVIIAGGYGHGGTSRMYSDVWYIQPDIVTRNVVSPSNLGR